MWTTHFIIKFAYFNRFDELFDKVSLYENIYVFYVQNELLLENLIEKVVTLY